MNNKKITTKKGLHRFIYSSMAIIILLVTVQMVSINRMNEYSHDQIVNEASSMANYNRITLLTLYNSIAAIEEIMTEQLETVAQMLATSSTYDNVDRNDLLSNVYAVDEINWFSPEGIVIYSSKDYEGLSFPSTHAVWRLLNGDIEYYTEKVRQDIHSDEIYLYHYLLVPDGSVVQVGLLADRLVELTNSFSYMDFLANSLDKESVLFAAIYMQGTNNTNDIIFSSDENVELTNNQLRIIKSHESVIQEVIMDGERVLEVYIPLDNDEGETLGTYFLIYSFEGATAFVFRMNLFIGLILIILFVIFAFILYNSFKHADKAENALYVDPESGLYNAKFISDHYDRIRNETHTSETRVAMFLITNYKRSQLLSTSKEMQERITCFVDTLNTYSEAQELYRFSDDIFFMVSHHRGHNDVLNSIDEVMANNTSDFDLKVGIIRNDEEFGQIESLFDVFEITGIMLRNSSSDEQLIMNSDIRQEIIQRQKIERDLRLLSIQGFGKQMHVVFQPQVDVHSGKITGFETLARWNHPEYGYISPVLIFEIADQNDYSVALTRWIATQAFEFINRLKQEGYANLIVSINISVSYIIKNEFVDNVSSLMDHYGILPHQFGIEITETTIDESTDLLKNRINALSKMGIKISIDDYGKGYSSLMRLKELDVHVLKIDKAFVDDINIDSRIIKNTIDMAKSMNLTMVAEGVEHEDQLNWLRENNCNIIQGYVFSPPLISKEAIEYLKNFKS